MLALDESDRRGPGSGGAAQPRVGEYQRELAHAVARELRRVEVLDDEHSVPRVEELWDLERPVGVLGGGRPVAPGVAAGERYAPVCQPAGELPARARLAREVRVGIVPMP